MMKFTKIAGILASFALIAACASTGPDLDASAGADTTTGSAPTGPVPGSQADLENAAGHRVFFGYDEYTLTGEAQATLARQAAWLKEYPETRILLAGNCDERGTREYNLALGERRANVVMSFLTSAGVRSRQIEAVSFGEERPADPGHSESAWSLNRRAVLSYR